MSPLSNQTKATPSHQYSSLADLLHKAGYKETRVFTPEAERFRGRIKKTFDEDDVEEVSALYRSFGLSHESFTRSPLDPHQHQRQTITEPSLPLKSSSSLLRSLASNADQSAEGALLRDGPRSESSSPADSTWWSSGFAASLGRAAKAVMEPHTTKPMTTLDDIAHHSSNLSASHSTPKETVRKVRSNWELDRSKRNFSDSPPQENRPPVLRYHTDTTAVSRQRAGLQEVEYPVIESAPPLAIDNDAFGYSPLPDDYEAQCEDDEALYSAMDLYNVGSLGSSPARSLSAERLRSPSESSDIDMVNSFNDVGTRILANAVQYDEIESPNEFIIDLPEVESIASSPRAQSPFLAPIASTVDTTEAESEADYPQQKPALKYGDRATKLRIAKSTPNLQQNQRDSSWLGSVRAAVLSRAGYAPIASPSSTVAQVAAPLRISPSVPAPPALVTTSPIVCDSASMAAEDLPAIPPTITVTAPSTRMIPLRLRSSLHALRWAAGFAPANADKVSEDCSPVLTPRMDWKQGSQFTGWHKEKHKDEPEWSVHPADSSVEIEALGLGIKVVSGGNIDYTQSFFYKPSTPPKVRDSEAGNDEEAASQPCADANPVARRQRSIKSLRAALLLPVASAPPVPSIPSHYKATPIGQHLSPSTPPSGSTPAMQPPVLAIQSPGAWEAGLPPRELVLEGEEWDARDGQIPGDWSSRRKGKKRVLKKQKSKSRV